MTTDEARTSLQLSQEPLTEDGIVLALVTKLRELAEGDVVPGGRKLVEASIVLRDVVGEAQWLASNGQEHLRLLCEQRSSRDNVLWMIYGSFWATNALLVVGMFSTGRLTTDWALTYTITFVGFLDAVAWYIIQRCALSKIDSLEHAASAIEGKLHVPEKLRVTYSRGIRRATQGTMILLSILVGLAWGAAVIFANTLLALARQAASL